LRQSQIHCMLVGLLGLGRFGPANSDWEVEKIHKNELIWVLAQGFMKGGPVTRRSKFEKKNLNTLMKVDTSWAKKGLIDSRGSAE